MATIDNLSIQVTASAESAASALDRLASSAGGLRGAATRAGGGLRDLSAGAKDAATETQKVQTQTEKTRISLHGFWNALKQSGSYLGGAFLGGMKGIVGVLGSMASGLLRIAKFRIYRTIIKDLGQSFKDLYGWSKMFGSEYANSMDRINSSFVYLRNSIASAAAPLFNALAPVLDAIIDKIVMLLNWLNQLFSALSGASTYTVAKKVEQSWGSTFTDTSKKAKKTADDIKRTILGFDEINKLTKDKDSSSGGGGGSSPYTSGYQYMFEEKELAGGWKDFATAIENAMSDAFSRITMIVGGAELALGAILALSGANVPLGLGLMATGAVTLGSAIFANWEGISKEVKLAVAGVEAAVAGGLAVGAVLAFSGGHVGLGIGLMIAALSTGMGAATIAWNTIGDKMSEKVQAIATLVGGASFGIGAVLAFAGHPGIGIAMMIAGASVTAVSINWNYLKEKLEGPIGTATALISGASLVLGVLALLSGNIPIGLGLILAGTAGLATTVAANWDNLVNIGKTAIEKVKEGMTAAVGGIANFIKTYIINPIVKAWNWLLGIFGGGNDNEEGSGVTSNASVSPNLASNASVGDTVAQEADQETIIKLNNIGRTMGEAINKGILDAVNGVVNRVWDTITQAWAADTRELPVSVKLEKSGWSTLAKYVGTYEPNVYVKLVKSGWSTLASYVGTYEPNVYVKLVKSGWSTLAKYVGTYEPNVYVKLVKSGWSTLAKYVGTYEPNVYVKLVKSGWSTLAKYVGTYEPNVYVKLVKSGWSTLAKYVGTYEPNVYVKLVKSGWSTLAKYVGTYEPNVYVKLVKSGWSTLAKYVGTYEPNVYVKLVKSGWSTLASYVGTYEPNVYVKLVKSGWSTLAKYVGTYEPNVYVKLVKSGWSSLASYVGEYTATVKVELEKDNWTDVSSYLDDNFGGATGGGGKTSGGGAGRDNKYRVSIGLKDPTTTDTDNFWARLGEAWDASVTAVDKGLDVVVRPVAKKTGGALSGFFSKVGEWLFGKSDTPETESKVKAVAGNGFSSVGNDGKMNLTGISDTDVKINLVAGNFSDGFKTWLTGNQWADVNSSVYLKNGNFSDGFKTWLTGNQWADVNSSVYLKNGNFSDGFKTWLTGNQWADVNSSVYLKAGNFKSLSSWLGDSVTVSVNLKAGGGVAYSNGYSASFASGGVISNGVAKHLSNIPHYASGTTDAHGTLFLAGEAGPEILGHIGGRTEILNQSQLASTMFSAVRSAMTGVRIGGSIENAVSTDNGEADYEAMYRAMYDAFTDAMTGSNERDKEKVALMRQIAAKEFTAEVTAASVNRAQTRMNRRAGTTIVPVGT